MDGLTLTLVYERVGLSRLFPTSFVEPDDKIATRQNSSSPLNWMWNLKFRMLQKSLYNPLLLWIHVYCLSHSINYSTAKLCEDLRGLAGGISFTLWRIPMRKHETMPARILQLNDLTPQYTLYNPRSNERIRSITEPHTHSLSVLTWRFITDIWNR